jgi:phospholipid transport system substrate-binding protein
VALLGSAGAAFAASPTETIQTAVARVLANDSTEQVKLASTADRRAQIRQGAESLFDFKEMARRSLGDRWEVLSRTDQDEFVRLFTNLIAASYMSKIELYAGEPIVFLRDPKGEVRVLFKVRPTYVMTFGPPPTS